MHDVILNVKDMSSSYLRQLAKVSGPFFELLKLLAIALLFNAGMSIDNWEAHDAVTAYLITAIACIAIDAVKCILKRKGLSASSVPVPSKRFTEVDEDGMVSVEQCRLQEMIVYVADVEDYLERFGRLK